MTVLLPSSRTLSKQLLPRSSQLLTRLASTNSFTRVSFPQNRKSTSKDAQYESSRVSNIVQQCRTFADAAARPAGRPKAHTGRTTTKRTTKKATGTRKASTTKAKPKKKAKAKPKPKAKPKAKPKTRVLSERGVARKEARERTALRKTALLNEAPKRLPDTAWQVCFLQHSPKKGERLSGSGARTAAQEYRNMSLEEREALNHTANENRRKNDIAHKSWVEKHSPLEIKQANLARNQLRRHAKKVGSKRTYPHIKDDRLVKAPANQYSLFLKDRYDSGDMKGMTIAEVGKLVGREWKSLSASEKKKYEDQHKAQRNQYVAEYKTVYGVEPPTLKTRRAATAA